MPAKVIYGSFIRITQIMDRVLKCLDRVGGVETWCISERQTMGHEVFRRGCLMKPFVRTFGPLIGQR
jgi:hypothetical protein